MIRWADQLLDALEYLHSQEPPIVHRDIKPQNLKLTERGQIILLDFGLAKGMPLHMTRMTSSGSIYGYTPSYAPMEQIQGAGTDPRSDLYSLGATLYHFLTGAVPLDALTRAAAVVEGEPDPLRAASEVNGQASSAVGAVLHRAMALSRNHRYETAAEMRRAIHAAGEPLRAAVEETAVIGAPRKPAIPLEWRHDQPLAPTPVQADAEEAVRDSENDETVLGESAARQAEVAKLISEGTSAFGAGQYALAIERWEEALKRSPEERGVKEGLHAAQQGIAKEQEQFLHKKILMKKQNRAHEITILDLVAWLIAFVVLACSVIAIIKIFS